ncbi:hypothetical protein [Chamaesiphon sp. VAR_69_metabat_338]|uniref:hypothetical protein n=1 Tax=Chamaesiphon sp. VAR_69_metabat_338 TaxID=2964704 RepID=UPI00286EA1F2|nr:hypothetical protein [Chamaesiphon sp. VAR_69_metabat_338]
MSHTNGSGALWRGFLALEVRQDREPPVRCAAAWCAKPGGNLRDERIRKPSGNKGVREPLLEEVGGLAGFNHDAY